MKIHIEVILPVVSLPEVSKSSNATLIAAGVSTSNIASVNVP
jgi:hypothetical protein